MTRSPRQRGPTDLLDVSSPEPWADRAGKVASRSGAHACRDGSAAESTASSAVWHVALGLARLSGPAGRSSPDG